MYFQVFTQRLRNFCLLFIAAALGLAAPSWASNEPESGLPGKESVQRLTNSLMYAYSKNSGNPQSVAKWRRKAALSGSTAAQLDLCEGLVEADFLREARGWCGKAAETGNAKAMFLLSLVLRDHSRTPGEEAYERDAKETLRLAAAKGYQPAIEWLTRVEGEQVRTEAELDKLKPKINETSSWNELLFLFALLGVLCLYAAYKTAQRAVRSKTWRIMVIVEAALVLAAAFLFDEVESDLGYTIAAVLFSVFILADGAVILIAHLLEKSREDRRAATDGGTLPVDCPNVGDEKVTLSASQKAIALRTTLTQSYFRFRKPAVFFAVGLLVYLGFLAISDDTDDWKYLGKDRFSTESKFEVIPEYSEAAKAYSEGLLSVWQIAAMRLSFAQEGSVRRHEWRGVSKHASGDLYVDLRSIRQNPPDGSAVSDVTLWVMANRPDAPFKDLLSIDCKKKTIISIGHVPYEKNMLDGKRKADFALRDKEANVVPKWAPPHTLFENGICQRYDRKLLPTTSLH